MNTELLGMIVSEVKSKNQIKDLEDSFVKRRVEKFLLTNGDLRKKVEQVEMSKLAKNKFFKEIVKRVREEIGQLYGQYLTKDFRKKEKLIDTTVEDLLLLHKSTRERVKFYDEIYEKIFAWLKPKYIADLACGLNPLSYPLLAEKLGYKPKYFASDLNPNDMVFLQEYFDLHNIPGKAKAYDITTLDVLADIKEVDMVCLFKALDSFEKVQRNISKELLLKLKGKHVVISFPTKSLVAKEEFKVERRNWLFSFLEKEGFEVETFEVENEMFLLVQPRVH